jgi:DNA-binding transcriptional ArsR family regulator
MTLMKSPNQEFDVYELVFTALAHAARRRVLLTIYFNEGAMTAGSIAATFEQSWPTTTRHLSVLESAGLISQEKQGRTRIYRIQTKRLELVRDWLSHFLKEEQSKVTTATTKATKTMEEGQCQPAKKKKRKQ